MTCLIPAVKEVLFQAVCLLQPTALSLICLMCLSLAHPWLALSFALSICWSVYSLNIPQVSSWSTDTLVRLPAVPGPPR